MGDWVLNAGAATRVEVLGDGERGARLAPW